MLSTLDRPEGRGPGKVGIVSHALPPSTSGQAIVLGRLLSGVTARRFVLISREPRADGANGANDLGALAYHTLPRLWQLPSLGLPMLPAPTITFNALWGIWRRAAQIEAIARREQCRLLVACSGDLHDIPASYLVCKRVGIPFVAYVFDDYQFQWTGSRRFVARQLERPIMRGADAIIVPNELMRDEYRERLQVESVVVHNPSVLPNLDELDRAADTGETHHQTAIVYTGSIYHAHFDAFRNLIRALGILGRADVKLHLYTPQPQAELADNGVCGPMVEYHGHIVDAEARRVTRRADVLFLPLAFRSPIPEVIRTSAPGKLGDYLGVGRPILAHVPAGSFVSGFLRERECGVVVDADDAAQLAGALGQLLDDAELRRRLGAQARQAAEREFDLATMQRRFLDVLEACGAEVA